MKFEDYLTESDAADQAKKQGLTAAGWGLWRDKNGTVVAKTVKDKLVAVKGSEANINHYHTNVPKNRAVNHAALDDAAKTLDKYLTPGTKTDTDVTKYGTHQVTAIHPDKAKHLHDDLIEAGFKYEQNEDFGSHTYRKGTTVVSISEKPEIAHDGKSKKKDHHSVVVSVDHTKPVKD